jgi:hypothetical protein
LFGSTSGSAYPSLATRFCSACAGETPARQLARCRRYLWRESGGRRGFPKQILRNPNSPKYLKRVSRSRLICLDLLNVLLDRKPQVQGPAYEIHMLR